MYNTERFYTGVMNFIDRLDTMLTWLFYIMIAVIGIVLLRFLIDKMDRAGAAAPTWEEVQHKREAEKEAKAMWERIGRNEGERCRWERAEIAQRLRGSGTNPKTNASIRIAFLKPISIAFLKPITFIKSRMKG